MKKVVIYNQPRSGSTVITKIIYEMVGVENAIITYHCLANVPPLSDQDNYINIVTTRNPIFATLSAERIGLSNLTKNHVVRFCNNVLKKVKSLNSFEHIKYEDYLPDNLFELIERFNYLFETNLTTDEIKFISEKFDVRKHYGVFDDNEIYDGMGRYISFHPNHVGKNLGKNNYEITKDHLAFIKKGLKSYCEFFGYEL